MLEHDSGIEGEGGEWAGGPADVRQRALAIIDTTRCEWTPRPLGGAGLEEAGAEPVAALPLAIARDAGNSRSARVQRVRARARRRAVRRFAV